MFRNTDTDIKTGAAYTRRRSGKNPIPVMARLMQDDPGASKETIINRWWKLVCDDYEEWIRDYVGNLVWKALHDKPVDVDGSQPERAAPKATLTREERAKRKEGLDKKAKEAAAEHNQKVAAETVEKVIKGELSLDFVMPDKRKFGDWLGTEVQKLGGRLYHIGKACGKKLVRQVIKTDEALQTFNRAD